MEHFVNPPSDTAIPGVLHVAPGNAPIGARRFINEWNAQGPAHHCAVGIGHIAAKLDKLGALLGIESVRIG